MNMLHCLCGQAKDGICNDGRVKKKPGEPVPISNGADFAFVLCDLGTDCADCGPWAPVVEPVW